MKSSKQLRLACDFSVQLNSKKRKSLSNGTMMEEDILKENNWGEKGKTNHIKPATFRNIIKIEDLFN